MSDRVKISGYSKKFFYDNNNIEWRPFSPDLVGVQLASNGGTPLFTMGNFAVTTNFDPKKDKRFVTNSFSNFVTLTDLDLTLESAISLLRNNDGVFLNLDKSNLMYYRLFGSLKEFTRVSLEKIISDWPAALYLTPIYQLPPLFITQSGFTYQNCVYSSVSDQSTFRVSTNVINNKFDINIISTNFDQRPNNLRNLNTNFLSYVVSINGKDYDIVGFTGATDTINDFIYVTVKGNAFSGTTNGYLTYYIKPNSINENIFYNSLDEFEVYLLNRYSFPKFTSTFSFTKKTDGGDIIYTKDTLTWPVTDGYNIDFDTESYEEYATRLLEITTNYDLTTSNLMVRFLVTESITDFDTTAVHLNPQDQDTSDQKMNKTLNIYGNQFDDINRYIIGIQYANVVSYNKVNNIPDIYLKNLARVLGWDLISSVLENNLLKNYLQPSTSSYSGYSIGLTAVEADIELWRRIILNTPWLWKSKGTRKGIEFLFKFIGTPLGLIKFNEYIYLAENKIDIEQFTNLLEQNNLSTDISNYPIDSDGYPSPKRNTPTMYFQNDGLWYRQTGGDESAIDITYGNNPHVGPYDAGNKYMNQFRELIPNFSATTITSSTSTIVRDNLFTNYNLGTFTQYSGDTYVDILTDQGIDFSSCVVVSATTIEDPKKRQDTTDCGCDIPENLRSLSICLEKTTPPPYNCQDKIANATLNPEHGYYVYDFYQYLPNGSIYTVNGDEVYYTSQFVDVECCSSSGMVPFYHEQYNQEGSPVTGYTFVNSGYICCNSEINTCGCYTTCKWRLSTPRYVTLSGSSYLQFKKENGVNVLTSKDGCNCIPQYTTPVLITASTTDIGYACQLTQLGLNDINSPTSIIRATYEKRSLGEIACSAVYEEPSITKVFGVVINNKEQVGTRLNNFEFLDLSNVGIGNEFVTVNTPLTANTNSVLSTGYFSTVQLPFSPLPNDIIRVETPKDLMMNATLAFNPNVGHRMFYKVSDTEFTPDTFMQNVFSGLTQIQVNQTLLYGQDYFAGQFNYIPTSNSSNLYIVIDLSQQVVLPNDDINTGSTVACPYIIRTAITELGYNQTGCIDMKYQIYLADSFGNAVPNPLSTPINVLCSADYVIGDCANPTSFETRTATLVIDPAQSFSTNFFAATNPNEYVQGFFMVSVTPTIINNCNVQLEQ